MSEDYSQRSFEFEGTRYQMVKTEKGAHMCGACEASGEVCKGTFGDHAIRKSCGAFDVRDGWHYVKAPKSLSLDEILAEQEATPSEDSADVLRYEASFRHGASEAQGWTARVEVSTDLPKHDGHYRTLEAKGAEPIERMEALVCRGIPEDLHRIAKRNLNMAMASKHQDRAGEKSGEDWEKELQKAENYLHRAWSGRWIG